MNTNYFCVTEANDDGRHVGTILAHTDAEFNQKLISCIEGHWDEKVEIPLGIKLSDIQYGNELIVDVKFLDTEGGTQVHVCETWLY